MSGKHGLSFIDTTMNEVTRTGLGFELTKFFIRLILGHNIPSRAFRSFSASVIAIPFTFDKVPKKNPLDSCGRCFLH